MSRTYSLYEKVAKGSLTILAITSLASLCAYSIRILLSRTLGVENYGLFYAIFGLFGAVTTYSSLGFGYSVVYLLPKEIRKKNYSKAWNIFIYGQVISLATSIIASSFFIVLAPFLAQKYFKVPGSEILIYIFCIYLISFSLINGLIQIFSGFQKEAYYSSISLSRWLLTLFFSFLLLTFGFSNILYYVIALCMAHILTVVIFSFLLLKKYIFFIKHKITWDRTVFMHMLSLAAPSLLETLIFSGVGLFDIFLLTYFKGVREVGIYNVVFPLASVSVILLNPFNALLLPLVSHLMEGEKEKLKYLMEKIFQIVPFIWLYFALFTIIFPAAIVGMIFGEKWLGLVETPLIILSLGTLPILMNGILGAVTLGAGRVKENLKVAAMTAIISVILSGILTYQYGVLGSVISISITALILNILFIRIIRSVTFFQLPYPTYIKQLVFSLMIYFLVKITMFQPDNWYELMLCVFTYTAIYTLFGYLFKLYDKKFVFIILNKKY